MRNVQHLQGGTTCLWVQTRHAAANAKLTNSDLSHADPSDCDKVFRL